MRLSQQRGVHRSGRGKSLRLRTPEEKQIRRGGRGRGGGRESSQDRNTHHDEREPLGEAGSRFPRRRFLLRGLGGRQQESKQVRDERRHQNEDGRLPGDSEKREDRHPAGDEGGAGSAGEAGPAGKGKAAEAGMREKRPAGERATGQGEEENVPALTSAPCARHFPSR